MERNIRCRRPYAGAELTRRHRQARQNWAANGAFLGRQPWRDVIFSDESRFCINHHDGEPGYTGDEVSASRTAVLGKSTALAAPR
jgi:hypothetical protein